MKFKDVILEGEMGMDNFVKFKEEVKKIYGKQVGSTTDFKSISTGGKLGQVHIIEKEGMSNNKDKTAIEAIIKKKFPKITKITWEKK